MYSTLSKIPLLKKSYAAKFVLLTFLGTHIPLICLLTYLSINESVSNNELVITVLIATLLATFLTIIGIKSLIKPLNQTSIALVNYAQNETLPELPMIYSDEIGLLMSNLQNTVSKIDALNKQNKYLISLLSHDMRTPINNALALCDLINSTNDKIEITEYTSVLKDSLKHQLSFLQNILTMLKLAETDKMDKSFENLNLKQTIFEIKTNLSALLAAKKITLKIDLEEELVVKGNKFLIFQVFTNIISNALKFSNEGQTIHFFAQKNNSKNIEVTVTDEGIGFDNSKADSLFDKFTNLGRVGTNNEPTNGIGLYLVKQIIQAHQGSIKAQSNGENKGATFTVLLPI